MKNYDNKKYKGLYRSGSLRLQTWDYSNDGAYFITICTKSREHFFGKIVHGQLQLNPQSDICFQIWKDLSNHYTQCIFDEFIIMPDHVHAIIIIRNHKSFDQREKDEVSGVKTIHESSLQKTSEKERSSQDVYPALTDTHTYRHQRRKMLLFKIIGRFKMQTSKLINEYDKMPGRHFWQPGYYEHIIRNENALYQIRKYIRNNPLKWKFKYKLSL